MAKRILKPRHVVDELTDQTTGDEYRIAALQGLDRLVRNDEVGMYETVLLCALLSVSKELERIGESLSDISRYGAGG